VASQWVNEEVRQFQALGRANRVLCMVVDGDPDAEPGSGGCFPPALFDGVDDPGAVPLAADPRKYADGRKLAKLKLVASLLGVQLDELRQRDLGRKRRWQAVGALAVAAAIALAAVAVSSTIAQRQERAKAEQMATFIVELGEDLQTELDLESLGRISARAMEYLENLDPMKLTPETNIRVGQALRQVGLVNLRQGKADEALAALERSRQLFRDLNDRYPERQDVLFELGQAEFYVGNYHFERGNLEAAGQPFENYYEVAKVLYDSDPYDRRWLLEMSYASGNRMVLHLRSDHAIDQQVLDETEANVRLAEQTLEAWPDSTEVLAQYSNVMAWAAEAHHMTCNLAEAGRYRQITVDQAMQASNGDRSNKWLRHYLAYRQTGLAGVLTDQGNLAAAEKHRLASLELLEGLLAADPSNQQLATDVAMSKLLLARLMLDTGRVETALDLMQQAEPDLRPTASLEQASKNNLLGYADYLLDRARLLWLKDDREGALLVLARLRDIFLLHDGGLDEEPEYRSRVAHLRYQWWEIESEDLADEFPALQLEEYTDWSGFQSCSDAVLGAELAVMRGDPDHAQRYADYLAAHGYRNPTYLNFCRLHQLCKH